MLKHFLITKACLNCLYSECVHDFPIDCCVRECTLVYTQLIFKIVVEMCVCLFPLFYWFSQFQTCLIMLSSHWLSGSSTSHYYQSFPKDCGTENEKQNIMTYTWFKPVYLTFYFDILEHNEEHQTWTYTSVVFSECRSRIPLLNLQTITVGVSNGLFR